MNEEFVEQLGGSDPTFYIYFLEGGYSKVLPILNYFNTVLSTSMNRSYNAKALLYN